MGDRVALTDGLDVVTKRLISASAGKRNPVVQPVALSDSPHLVYLTKLLELHRLYSVKCKDGLVRICKEAAVTFFKTSPKWAAG